MKSALEKLKSNGYRITLPRKLVLKVITESDHPLNPYEIAEKIESEGENIDVVTVYRIMEVLEELDVVHFLKGEKKYLKCDHPCDEHCHHQFICDSCGNVNDLHLNDQDFIKNIFKKYPKLKIEKHYFEFSGQCNNCK